MAKAKIKWHGKRVQRDIMKQLDRNVSRAASFLQSDIQDSLSRGGGRANVSRTGPRSGTSESGPVRSRPGEPPRAQTGGAGLLGHIFKRRARQATYEVGTNLDYGVFHELGIRYSRVGFQQRPFIRPALKRNKKILARIVGGKS